MTRALSSMACAIACATTMSAAGGGQMTWVHDWLVEYANGRHAEVADRLRTVADLRLLEHDLEKTAPKFLDGPDDKVRFRRRVLAAFALEAANGRLAQGMAATKLLEWGCRQVRRVTKPDEFERRWHAAAFAMFAGAVDPDALEAHTAHARFQFPADPRLVYQRAVALELGAAPVSSTGRDRRAGEIRDRYEEAARRYLEATKHDSTRLEASLRLGRVELTLGRYDRALEALNDVAHASADDPQLAYLAQLFRGLAFDRLDRHEEAEQAFRSALSINADAQSAAIALSALLFRTGRRDEADSTIASLLSRPRQAVDPWWLYWPGDYRYAARLIADMRRALQ